MDKEHARFILQSYRPDGADAKDPHFTEALQLAAENRELGEWLANERADDALFAEALKTINIPEDLRDEIFSVLEHDAKEGDDLELDGVFSGALAMVQTPAGLRDQIISAMEVERASAEPHNVTKIPTRWFNYTAIAALLMIGIVFVFSLNINSDNDHRVALHDLQIQSGALINASHEVTCNKDSLDGVNQWLVSNGLPEADSVPQGLIATKTKGGRKLILDNGVEASMIFFEKKDVGNFYLMILKLESIGDVDKIVSMDQINVKRCKTCPVTSFNVTSWKDDKKVYMLLTKEDGGKVVALF